MSDNLPDAIENALLDHLLGVATLTITTPLKLRLMTVNGSDSAAGTEVVGGTYVAQTITFGSAAAGSSANSNLVRNTGMPACTVVGAEIWDTGGTPKRLWYGPATANKTVTAGDILETAIGAHTVTFS